MGSGRPYRVLLRWMKLRTITNVRRLELGPIAENGQEHGTISDLIII